MIITKEYAVPRDMMTPPHIGYDVESLIYLTRDLPIIQIHSTNKMITKLMTQNAWSIYKNKREFIVTPQEALYEFYDHHHIIRTKLADTTKPILFFPNGELADGYHRVAKAIKESIMLSIINIPSWQFILKALVDEP